VQDIGEPSKYNIRKYQQLKLPNKEQPPWEICSIALDTFKLVLYAQFLGMYKRNYSYAISKLSVFQFHDCVILIKRYWLYYHGFIKKECSLEGAMCSMCIFEREIWRNDHTPLALFHARKARKWLTLRSMKRHIWVSHKQHFPPK
jgi:hypothetical protein